MNPRYINNHIIAGLFYILVVILLGSYQYVTNGGYQFYNLWNSIGFSGVVISGIFLYSKLLHWKWVNISSWQNITEHLGTWGISLNLTHGVISFVLLVKLIPVTVQENDLLYAIISAVSIGVAAVLIPLVTYINGLYQANPSADSSANLKSREAFGLLLTILLITIINKLRNWGAWFNNLTNLNNHLSISILPPVSLIISVYIVIIVLIYVWGLITEHNETGTTDNPPTPPPTPTVPTPSQDTPQNIPITTGASTASNVTENQSAQTQ